MCCEGLICASCAGPVVEGRCSVCRAARDEGRTTSALALARQAVTEYGHERTKARLAVVQAAHAYERFRVEGAGEEVLELMRSALADLGVPGAETVRAAYTAKHARMLLSAGRPLSVERASIIRVFIILGM